MSDKVEILRAQYLDVLKQVPYNTAIATRKVADAPIPPHMGDICIGQTALLQQRICERGIGDTRVLRDVIHGRHHPLVVIIEGVKYYSDVYLMLHEPINLNRVVEQSETDHGLIRAKPLSSDKLPTHNAQHFILLADISVAVKAYLACCSTIIL